MHPRINFFVIYWSKISDCFDAGFGCELKKHSDIYNYILYIQREIFKSYTVLLAFATKIMENQINKSAFKKLQFP